MARFGMIGNQYADDAGNPLIKGLLFFFESGTNLEKKTYADVDHEIENSNPVKLTGAGRQPNVFFDGTAKVILTDSNLVQIEERDPEGATVSSIFGPWNAFASYDNTRASIVEASDGNLYQSLQNANKANNPTTSPAFWEQIEFNRFYNENVTYSINDIAVEDGAEYRSRVDNNQNNTPSASFDKWANTSGIGQDSFDIKASDMVPRSVNGAEKASVQLSNGLMVDSFNFDAATDEFIQFQRRMPANWDVNKSINMIYFWSHGATTTNFNVDWEISAHAFRDNSPLDISFATASETLDAGGVTNDLYETAVGNVIIQNAPEPGDLVVFQVNRDTGISNNLAIDARLMGIVVLYHTVSSVEA